MEKKVRGSFCHLIFLSFLFFQVKSSLIMNYAMRIMSIGGIFFNKKVLNFLKVNPILSVLLFLFIFQQFYLIKKLKTS